MADSDVLADVSVGATETEIKLGVAGEVLAGVGGAVVGRGEGTSVAVEMLIVGGMDVGVARGVSVASGGGEVGDTASAATACAGGV